MQFIKLILLYVKQFSHNLTNKRYNRNWLKAFYRLHRDGFNTMLSLMWLMLMLSLLVLTVSTIILFVCNN